MGNKQKRIRKTVSKLGWLSFAGYAATKICGIDRVAGVASILAVTCAVMVSSMNAVEDIQEIVAHPQEKRHD